MYMYRISAYVYIHMQIYINSHIKADILPLESIPLTQQDLSINIYHAYSHD
jgi:hypothetical protein